MDITTAFKKGNQQDSKNCRLIASLIAVDKIFEQLLCNKINMLLRQNSVQQNDSIQEKSTAAKQRC